MSFMKIYTKTGDKGQSSLFSGERVSKNHLRLQVYGELDHLNVVVAQLGLLVPASEKELLAELQFVQDRVFTASSQLATVDQTRLPASFRPIAEEDIVQLERFIDQLSEQLPVLSSFVIPGGNQANVSANLARVITRKTERLLVELMKQEELPAVILQFLNRLSDWFFTVSRFVIHISQEQEVMWRAK